MPLGGLIDVPTEKARIKKDIGKAEKEIAALEKKLGNAGLPVARARGGRRRDPRSASPTSRPRMQRCSTRSTRSESSSDASIGAVARPRGAARRRYPGAARRRRCRRDVARAGRPQHARPDRGRDAARPADRRQPAVPEGPRRDGRRRSRTALRDAPSVHRFDKIEFSAAACADFAALAPKLEPRSVDRHRHGGARLRLPDGARARRARLPGARRRRRGVAAARRRTGRSASTSSSAPGAIVTSTEVCVFDLLGRAGTDEFKALSKLIK